MKNVLICGAGFMGKTHAAAYQKLGIARVAGLIEENEESGKSFCAKFECKPYSSLAHAFTGGEIDIVDVCLPTFLHEQFALEALAAGKHVLLEKPMTLTLESAKRIVSAAKASKQAFMMGQVLRFWPEYVKAKQLLDSGALGKATLVSAYRLAQHPNWSPWFSDAGKSGGGLYDLMMHDVDYVNHLFGPAKTVYAVGQKSPHGAWNDVTASFEFSSGANAVVESQFNMSGGYPFSMGLRVMGDVGTVEFKFSAGFNLEDRDSAVNSFVLYANGHDPSAVEIEHPDGYEEELKYFVDCVEKGIKPSTVTPDSSLDTMRMIDAVHRSLESKEKIIL